MKKLLCYLVLLTIFIPNQIEAELITQKVIDKSEIKYNRFSKNRFIAINKKLLDDLKDSSTIKKLNRVNTWVNFIKYKKDIDVYNVVDYWATLYEFVGKGVGDCEDYTIAKYYILKELGIDPRRLKFTYVIYKTSKGEKVSHMVLAYLKKLKPKSKDDILILDNTNKRLLPASKRPNIVRVIKMINGDTGAKSKKWKKLERAMKRKKL